jgi:hypothetical protein
MKLFSLLNGNSVVKGLNLLPSSVRLLLYVAAGRIGFVWEWLMSCASRSYCPPGCDSL